jgi:hypothetical protein
MKELLVEATDQKQNRRTIVIPVIAQGSNGQSPRSSAAKYALIVGISNYGAAKGAPPALPQAAADAGSMARDLEAAGFKKDNIRLLRDDAANRDALRIGFYDFAAKAQANDLLVIYVAGRAMHDPQPGNNEKMYLAPFGTQMKAMDSTAISFLEPSERPVVIYLLANTRPRRRGRSQSGPRRHGRRTVPFRRGKGARRQRRQTDPSLPSARRRC